MESWYMEYLRLAYAVALDSPDPSTQNGAVVLNFNGKPITGKGCNTFTKGIKPEGEVMERPLKYTYIEHAERNAIYDAASRGENFDTMVVAWGTCADCARAVVQSGITLLIRHDRSEVDRWSDSIYHGDKILEAAGVEVITVKAKLEEVAPVLANGELWQP